MVTNPTNFGDHIMEFIGNNLGWTYNFIVSNILFWVYGFTVGVKYGFNDVNFKAAADEDISYAVSGYGSIPSGPSGSGVLIISTLLVLGATVSFLSKAYHFHPTMTKREHRK
jgi:hypothetical protein